VLDDHIHQTGRRPEELLADDLEQRLDVDLVGRGGKLDSEGSKSLLEVGSILAEDLSYGSD